MEDIRQCAPAGVPGERSLFVLRRFAAFVFNQPQRADRGDIIARLFLQSALPDPMRLGYPEVARRRRGRRFRLDVPDLDVLDGGRAVEGWSSLSGSAHSCIASSHAA